VNSELKALSPAEQPSPTVGALVIADPTERVFWVGVVAFVLAYVALIALGARFFVYKTAVMPIFVMYGALLRDRRAFIADWLRFLSGTVLFDLLRGATFVAVRHGVLPVFADYVIHLEKALFGTPAVPVVFQRARSFGLDMSAVFLHGSHFAFFLLFGLVLWHVKRSQFDYFCRVLLLTMTGGLIGYVIVPTVPPWLAASQFHLLPPIVHVATDFYGRYLPDLFSVFDSNPVAAMPSLHAAFPTACAIVAWRTLGRRAGILTGLYAACLILSVIYLGEHYAVDALAGILLAAGASWLAISARPTRVTLPGSVALAAFTLSLTAVVAYANS
jgi:membrane-associated phospholipid phosphatase